MNVTRFLENLAKEAHYSLKFNSLIKAENEIISDAIIKNDFTLIQSQFFQVNYLAHHKVFAETNYLAHATGVMAVDITK